MMREKIVEDFSLEALRAGDRAEFARLVEAYSGAIYRLALRMLENTQDAEDALQETFLKAHRGLVGFDGRSSLSTWLYRIAANEALMIIRRRKNRPLPIDEDWDNDEPLSAPVQIVDWRNLPESELISAEARRMMEKAVESLPHTLRAVFLLREIEGLSTHETGEVLNISEPAVKTRFSRARLRLREALSEYYGERVGGRRAAEGDTTA